MMVNQMASLLTYHHPQSGSGNGGYNNIEHIAHRPRPDITDNQAKDCREQSNQNVRLPVYQEYQQANVHGRQGKSQAETVGIGHH